MSCGRVEASTFPLMWKKRVPSGLSLIAMEAFRPSPWELFFRANGLPPAEAVRYYLEHRSAYPETAGVDYNLACVRARAGDHAGAIADFRRAFERAPDDVRKWSKNDSDLDSIRAEVEAILG